MKSKQIRLNGVFANSPKRMCRSCQRELSIQYTEMTRFERTVERQLFEEGVLCARCRKK